ncbi:hypothetical protein [Dokdonia sp.]
MKLDNNRLPENECSSCGKTQNEIVIGFDICDECWMEESCNQQE